jgi:membrane protein implicated in regulation of membrane protease activity
MKYKRYTAHTIITTLLEEAAMVAVVLWLLPRFGINIPLWGLTLMIVALGTYACVAYRLGRKALDKKPIFSPDVGSRGQTTTPISPTGYVRVNGELWRALSSYTIGAGEEIAVSGMEGMTLLVSPVEKADHECKVDTLVDKH